MGNIKQIDIKNRINYIFNDMINIIDFDSSLLKIIKNSDKSIGICNIGYITIKTIDDCESIHSVNPLYLMTAKVDGYIEEKNGSKYLVFDSAGKSREVLKKYIEPWDSIKNEIDTINGAHRDEYGKDFMKIKFDSDGDLPLNKPLKLHMLTIIVRSVCEDEGKFYRQIYLDECL